MMDKLIERVLEEVKEEGRQEDLEHIRKSIKTLKRAEAGLMDKTLDYADIKVEVKAGTRVLDEEVHRKLIEAAKKMDQSDGIISALVAMKEIMEGDGAGEDEALKH